MFLKFKFSLILPVFLFLFFSGANLLNAAWWDTNAIPVPPESKEVNKEARKIGGNNMDFTYYTSNMTPEQIGAFYRRKLSLAGWQEKNLAESMSKINVPNLNKDSLKKILENNVLFEKDGQSLILNFMPEGSFRDGKVRFTLTQVRANAGPQNPESFAVPELLAKPKKDVAPVYPGAKLINLGEKASSLQATYFSQDNIEQINLFYKTKMSDYGWHLANEQPIKKMSADACPTCQKIAAVPVKNVESWFAQMEYSNQRGDSCRIGLAEVITAAAQGTGIHMSTITIDYNEKNE